MISVRHCSKSAAERSILTASIAAPANIDIRNQYVYFLSLTDDGYAKVNTVCPSNLEDQSGPSAIIYRMKPIQPNDCRIEKPWHKWPGCSKH